MNTLAILGIIGLIGLGITYFGIMYPSEAEKELGLEKEK